MSLAVHAGRFVRGEDVRYEEWVCSGHIRGLEVQD